MPPQDEQLITHAAAEITAWLAARPNSADTLEGIHRWWIRWPGPEEAISVTEAAVQRLLAAGLLEEVQVGSRLIWRRRR
jgi:hypothetical protein